MKKLAISLVSFVVGALAALAGPINPFTFETTNNNSVASVKTVSRVGRGQAAYLSLTNSATNAMTVTFKASSGTIASYGPAVVIYSGTVTGSLSVYPTNYLYNETVDMTISNATTGGMTNTVKAVLVIKM